MKKKIGFVFSLFFMIIMLSACSSNDYLGPEEEPTIGEDNFLLEGTPERKIIYRVDASYDVSNISDAVDTLKSFVLEDEWFDQENESTSYASFVIRIKTERLDAFMLDLKEVFQQRSYNKSGEDISLAYQDKTEKVLSLTLQQERLQALYDSASFSDMIVINKQLSDVEAELRKLEGELNVFDSLVEYSTVEVRLYGSTIITRSPFFNRLGNAFVNGAKGLLSFLDGLVIVVATIIPFAVVFVPAGYFGLKFYKSYQRKQKIKFEAIKAARENKNKQT